MNPALQLATLLQLWQHLPAGQTVIRLRFNDVEDDVEKWRQQASAVELVSQVERVLDGMDAVGDDTSEFRRHLPTWYAAIFSSGFGFNRPYPSDHTLIDPEAISALRMLSVVVNRISRHTPMPQDERERLAELLEEIYLDVEIIDGLADRDKIAILGLIRAAQRILGRLDFATGYKQLDAHLSELAMQLALQARSLPGDNKEGTTSAALQGYASRLTRFIFAAGSGGAFAELGAEVTRHITGA